MNALYYAENHRGVDAQSASEAAEIIAERKARAAFGSAGAVGACRVESQSQDGRTSECEAFIGRRVQGSGIEGRNVRFTLHLR